VRVKILTFVIFLSISISPLFAGGFQLNENSARALGMGDAFTGIADDPSAIYFNGAGLTQLTGVNFMIGSTLIAPVFSFKNTGPLATSPMVTEYDATKQTFFPTHFYATYKYNSDWAFGIGFTSPFGLGSQWDTSWAGRYLATGTTLQVFTISPVAAYNLLDNLSISAGLVYSFGSVDISKVLLLPGISDGFLSMNGSDKAEFGYNLGALYKPIDKLSLGVSFHSKILYRFKGNVSTTLAPQYAPLVPFLPIPNGNVSADLTTPINLAFGAAYRIIPDLLISADFQYVGWASYDTLTLNFSNPKEASSNPRLYDNSYIVRLGGEYNLNSDWKVRAGIYFDKSPVKPEYVSPSLPESDRLGYSCGLSYKMTNNFSVDAAYLYIKYNQLTVTNSQEDYLTGNVDPYYPFNGTYNAYANLLSITLSYSL
jgi:long-chain fatty acid transport protein